MDGFSYDDIVNQYVDPDDWELEQVKDYCEDYGLDFKFPELPSVKEVAEAISKIDPTTVEPDSDVHLVVGRRGKVVLTLEYEPGEWTNYNYSIRVVPLYGSGGILDRRAGC